MNLSQYSVELTENEGSVFGYQGPELSNFDDGKKIQRSRKTADPRNLELKERFDEFIHDIRISSKGFSEESLAKLLQSLNFKSQGILCESQLALCFDSLMRKLIKNPRYGKTNWTEEETNFLVSIVAYYCSSFGSDFDSMKDKDWEFLGQIFPTKQASQLGKRWYSILKVNLGQSPWTPLEDKQLATLVTEYGSERQWKIIADKINSQLENGVFRHSRQCRERWINYIDPKIKRGDWTLQEDLDLMRHFLKLGKKWSAIAKLLGDRTENAARNRWSSLIKKVAHGELDRNFLNEKDKNFEIRMATKYIEQATIDCFFDFSEQVSQTLEEFQDYEKDYTSQIHKPNHQEVETNAPIFQAETLCYDKKSEFDTLYLKPVGWDQNAFPYISLSRESRSPEPILSTHKMVCQMNDGINRSETSSKLPFQSFKVSSGYAAEQKFSREVSKTESQVFYAMIDPTRNEINLMEKVSQANWSKFMGNTLYYQDSA